MNSVALITGAGSGIGRALAKKLASEGHIIAAIDRRDDGLRSLADEIAGKPYAWAIADVTDPPALIVATRELEAKLGPIDLLIANAGIGAETSGLNYNIDVMNKVMTVNLLGVSNSIGAVLPGMIERRRGHLVAISSVASYRGLPRMLAYCASKAGVNAIMDGLRVELAPLGIDVTTVCPGWVRTPLTEKLEGTLEHILEVDDAAEEIVYAIKNKLAFYAFPRMMRWKLGFMMMWPRSWQDWYITRTMNRIKMVGGES
ncbi:MAG: SDR family NAD(P)-dependent oxidoreductase [Planctomycetes bacterium]|nr:SDR family NAD(P)-dependent oxidoreductase [Planctomycetota bacterium]